MEDKPQAPWELTPEALAKVQDAPPEPPEPSHEDEPREPIRDFRRTTPAELGIALALAFIAVVSVMTTYRGIGHSWDEAYYYEPAQMTVAWTVEFFSNPKYAASTGEIDRLWSGAIDPATKRPIGIIELPSICKWAMGISWGALQRLWGDQMALRFPAALAFGGSVFLIYLLTLNSYRRRAAVIAAVTFMVMPRVFGHAHFAATETITSFVLLLAIYCFFKGLNSPWWAVLFGISYGVALATKINAVLLAPALLVWGHAFHRRTYVNNFFAMAFLGPVVWVLLWPWLWHDTFSRILQYLYFFSRHQQTAVWYLGETYGYGRENAPWHYPIVLTVLTVPVPVLVFAICGLARTAVHCRWEYRGILFTGYATLLLVHAALPSTPKYDGTRLFFSVFPMLGILAGGGADSLVQLFPWNRTIWRNLNVRHVVATIFLLIILGNGVWAIIRYHPHELAYFNVFTGGLEGARHRFEWTYWGEALNEEVLDYLNALPEENPRIKTLAMHAMVLEHYQEWGKLRKDLQINPAPAKPGSATPAGSPYDYWLLHMRLGFFGRVERYLFDRVPEKAFTFHNLPDVPFFAIYSRDEAGELAQPVPASTVGSRIEQ